MQQCVTEGLVTTAPDLKKSVDDSFAEALAPVPVRKK
jgi:hypothetical protein